VVPRAILRMNTKTKMVHLTGIDHQLFRFVKILLPGKGVECFFIALAHGNTVQTRTVASRQSKLYVTSLYTFHSNVQD
jgi:hypothetical protein